MQAAALLLFALAADPAAVPPPPQVSEAVPVAAVKPTEVKGQPGRAVRLTAAGGKAVRWELGCSSEDCDLIPGGTECTFVAAKPGRYLVLAYTAAGDAPGAAARTVVVVGDPPPGPVTPPGPGPVTPPGPVVPPKPADPLADKLRKAFADNTAPLKEKTEAVKLLAELYSQAETLAKDPIVNTTGELVARLKTLSATLTADTLPECRKLIAAELAAAFPVDVALTDESRIQAAALFHRVSACLKEVVK